MLLCALAVIWLECTLHKSLLLSPRFGAPWATTKERKRKASRESPPNQDSVKNRSVGSHILSLTEKCALPSAPKSGPAGGAFSIAQEWASLRLFNLSSFWIWGVSKVWITACQTSGPPPKLQPLSTGDLAPKARTFRPERVKWGFRPQPVDNPVEDENLRIWGLEWH
jgi:hypothetical protein